MINVNFDKEQILSDSIQMCFEGKNVLFDSCSNGVYNNMPYWNVKFSINGLGMSCSCDETVFNQFRTLPPATPVTPLIRLDMRYKKIKCTGVLANNN